ncbi:MAG: ABC transporter ATP-binding protein [Candidatus Thermoplasmatota archaeon]|jgi:ABC-2 type transport system ATP-binding protein|nr:ABC transporter ATP-binding protein [Candidatus Thermoplasmatota archaeon]MDP7265554.1 ABC transporter ATP-binding protein [Candidatus Thermoplasmatota archaeon]
MNIIKTENLTKRYGKVEALRGVSLEVGEGAVGLLGPNGAGKTTLLRILLGQTKKTSGTAMLLNTSISDKNFEVRRNFGYMPEHECLVPTMNAVTFISYMAMINGLPRSDAVQRAHEALHYVGIGDERYRFIKTYSTGMRQKIKFAQAIAHDPQVLFLDEPTNGMDPEGRRQILDLIKDVHVNHGKSVVLSSHLLADVEAICDHVIVLNEGKLVLDDLLSALTGTDKNTLDIKIKGDGDRFMSVLEKQGFNVTREENLFKVERKGDTLDIIVKLCAENGIQLRYANQSFRSLEDIFIEIISRSSGKGGVTVQKKDSNSATGGGSGAN